ncbi:MAG TPA: SWIM zinc finger family protein [Kofleriaceae bacterium]|nr:SWIM zinc finger family protein [Kofleriaceae bacterium]
MTPGTRQARGLDLAKAKHQHFHRIDEDRWIVPSATCSQHAYLVDASRSTCTCPDSERGAKCKHLWAVAYVQNKITLIDGTQLKPPPVTDATDLETISDVGEAS